MPSHHEALCGAGCRRRFAQNKAAIKETLMKFAKRARIFQRHNVCAHVLQFLIRKSNVVRSSSLCPLVHGCRP